MKVLMVAEWTKIYSPVSDFGLKQPVYKVSGGEIIKNCVHLIRERAIGVSAAEFFNDGDFFWETEQKRDKISIC